MPFQHIVHNSLRLSKIIKKTDEYMLNAYKEFINKKSRTDCINFSVEI